MKFRVLTFILLILSISRVFSIDESYIYGKKTLQIIDEISPFFPREENSLNENLLNQYLENFFDRINADYSTLDYSNLEKGHSFSKGYSINIQGEIDDVLIIAVPLNNSEVQNSTRDGSINIALALQLLDIFIDFKPPVSLEFLFLGAERGENEIYPIGSNYYLNNYSATYPTVALYLDLSRQGDTIAIKNSSDSDLSPMWLVESFAEQFMEKKLNFSTENIQTLVYQSGFEKASPIINTYLGHEVPMVLLESIYSENQVLSDGQWINALIETILSFVLNSQQGFNHEWDRHYFISKINGFLITLGEKDSLIIMIGLLSVLFIILLLRSRNLHLNLLRFRNHLWTYPLLFFLTFMYLFLSTLIIEEISSIKDFPQLWQQYPVLFLLFKLFTALFLYSAFIYLIKGLSISPSHHFYTYSAFFSVIISIFAILIYNINFSYFFLWSLFIIAVFMISRNEFIKRIAIILSPLPLLIICYLVFTTPYLEICGFILNSRIYGNLFLTIIIMPTLMLISSLSYYHHRFNRHRKNFRSFSSILFWGTMTLLTLYNITNSTPFGIVNKQPVYIDEVIDLNEISRSILLQSPAPIGDIVFYLDERKLQLYHLGRSAEITAPIIPDLLEISEESLTFLDRMSLQYNIQAKGHPEQILIQLQSEKSLIIFDSNFPYEVSADGKTIDFFIGKNPILPLKLELIIPRGSKPDIHLQVKYKEFPYNFTLSEEKLVPEKALTIIKDIYWED
ncbi:MAG: hypothetical protein JEY91_05230 [Spirochaetaceae bacterium]|nr:hypothetical protein [Spirochaetaceae bacterium]